METLLIPVALFLAFANGANDNFKGFATVWGSQTLNFRRALLLATGATLAGSLFSLLLAQGLVQQFSGKGLLPDAVVGAPTFMFSVGLGAALTVMLATRVGLPVSTTHALIGALVGAGLATRPDALDLSNLAGAFILPLLLSPVLAAALGIGAQHLLRRLRAASMQADCVCVLAPAELAPAGMAALRANNAPQLRIDSRAACAPLAASTVARASVPAIRDRLHIASAALICFSRGVNDTPKLAALMIAAPAVSGTNVVLLIALAMGVGGLLFARRVAHTMSKRLATMDHTQGLGANLITSTLVILASLFALPVSTTHVSVGSIAGVASGAGSLDRATLRSVLLSWVATLPLAALLAWVCVHLFAGIGAAGAAAVLGVI